MHQQMQRVEVGQICSFFHLIPYISPRSRRPQEVTALPFTFVSSDATMCPLLQRYGVHHTGLWARQCGCCADRPWGSLCPLLQQLWGGQAAGDGVPTLHREQIRRELSAWWGLPASQVPCMLSAAASGARCAFCTWLAAESAIFGTTRQIKVRVSLISV